MTPSAEHRHAARPPGRPRRGRRLSSAALLALALALALPAPVTALPHAPVVATASGVVAIPVRCAAGVATACHGYIELTLRPGGAHISRHGSCLTRSCRASRAARRPRGRRIGSGSFAGRIGHILSVRVALGTYAAQKLRREGRLNVRATVYTYARGRAMRASSRAVSVVRSRR